MPYSSVEDIPQSVKDRIKSPKKRRQWLHVWNSEYERHHDESRAFAGANSAVKKAAGMAENNEQKFSFFLPLAKVDKENRTVSGYASTECVDCDGEIVSRDAIKAALPGYMVWKNIREMHQPSAVGKATEANMDGKGLYLTAKIVDDAAWKKVEEDVYKGFSIGGRKLAKNGNTITKLDLIEVSLVDRPANPECAISVQKSAKVDGAEAYLIPAPKASRNREALKKMAEVVDILADETNADLEKREFDTKERESAAESGAALPDGSFPIKNKKDLDNARQAVGRAKDPQKARAHIRARAAALGVKLPDSWSKKLGKRLVAKAEAELTKSASAPSSMTLDAGGGAEAAEGKAGLSHGLNLEGASPSPLLEDGGLTLTKRERKLLKRMGIAGSLSYCFDSIREAQRSLILEGKREGGDQKDAVLAAKLGTIAQNLAGVIGQKAAHEGEEALSLTDADDVGMMSILGNGDIAMTVDTRNEPDALSKMILGLVEKASGAAAGKAANPVLGILKAAEGEMKNVKKARKDVEECVKSAFEMCKMGAVRKAALKKAGKSDDDADDKAGEVMKMLQKAFGALQTQKAATKAASLSIAKAARVSSEGTVEDPVPGVYDPPDGIRTISPNEMDDLKASKAGYVSRSEVEALLKAAAAEAENKLLKSMPAQNGAKPYAFDVTKVGLGGNEAQNPVADFFKGANPANLVSDNATLRESEIAKSIGDKILGGGGKMIFDPAFHGTAGAS